MKAKFSVALLAFLVILNAISKNTNHRNAPHGHCIYQRLRHGSQEVRNVDSCRAPATRRDTPGLCHALGTRRDATGEKVDSLFDSNMPNKTPKKPCCKKCSRPLKGHIGQHGKKCTMDSIDFLDIDGAIHNLREPTSVSPSSVKGARHSESNKSVPGDSNTAVINELVNQVARLTAQVEHLKLHKSKRGKTRRHTFQSDSDSSSDSDTSDHTKDHANTICLSNGARISLKKYKAAQMGEFVNLNDFLPAPCIPNPGKKSTEDDSKGKPFINDFFGWLTAYTGYMEVILQNNPAFWKELMKHRMNIMEFDVRYNWSAVYMYELQFRAKMAIEHDLKFGHIDSDIMLSILTPDTLRDEPKVCFRCKSAYH